MPKSESQPRSIPLKEAAYFYASRRLKEDLEYARSLPFQKISTERPADGAEAIRAAATAATTFFSDIRTRSEPYYEMERDLVRKLQSRKLEAWGVQVKPSLGLRLTKIPHFAIDYDKIAFHKNMIEFEGRIFKSVEIRKPIKSGTPGTSKTKNKAGRKSIDKDLDKIVSSLMSQTQLSGIQKREMVSRVRDEAKRKHPNSFPSSTQPSATKIREALKRAGF